MAKRNKNFKSNMNSGRKAQLERVQRLQMIYDSKTRVSKNSHLDLIDKLESENKAKHPPKPKAKPNAHLDLIDSLEAPAKAKREQALRRKQEARSAVDWINSVEGEAKSNRKRPKANAHLDLIDSLEAPKPKTDFGKGFDEYKKSNPNPKSLEYPKSPIQLMKEQQKIDTTNPTGDYYGTPFADKPKININPKIKLTPLEKQAVGYLERVGIEIDPSDVKKASFKNTFKRVDKLATLEKQLNKDPNSIFSILDDLNKIDANWGFTGSKPNQTVDDMVSGKQSKQDTPYQNMSFAEMAAKGFAPKNMRNIFEDLYGQRARGEATVSDAQVINLMKNYSDELKQRAKERYDKDQEDIRRGFDPIYNETNPELRTYYDDSEMEKFKDFIKLDADSDVQKAELIARVNEKEWGQISQTRKMRTVLIREITSATKEEVALLYASMKENKGGFLSYSYEYGSSGDRVHNAAQKDDLLILSEVKGKDITLNREYRPPANVGRGMRSAIKKQ